MDKQKTRDSQGDRAQESHQDGCCLGARTQTGCTGKVEGHAAAVTNAD